MKLLTDDLTTFPFIKNDDRVDAFSQLVIYTYTDVELKIYGRQFDEGNILDNFNPYGKPVDLAIFKRGNTWKILEMAINYGRDTYIAFEEHVFTGKTSEIIPKIRSLAKGKRQIYDASKDGEVYKLLMGKIPVQPNIADLKKTILSVRNGFVKNKIKITRNCTQTISDIETYRYTRESYDKGEPVPVSLYDGFAGCLRVVIGAIKGEDAIFY